MIVEEYLNKIIISPDYFEVFPMGVGEFNSRGNVPGNLVDNSILDLKNQQLNNPMLPLLKLSDVDREYLLQKLEEYINRDITLANSTMRTQLQGAIKDLEEARKQLVATNNLAKAILDKSEIAVVTDNEALASQIEVINASFAQMKAQIGSLMEAYSNADSAVAQRVKTIEAGLNDKITSKVAEAQQAITTNVNGQINSLASTVRTLNSSVNGMDAKINEASSIATVASRDAQAGKNLAATMKSMLYVRGEEVLGWKAIYSDGSTGPSNTFKITTDKFKLMNPTTKQEFTFSVDSNGSLVLGDNVLLNTQKQKDIVHSVERYENNTSSVKSIRMANRFENGETAILFYAAPQIQQGITTLWAGKSYSGDNMQYSTFTMASHSGLVVLRLRTNVFDVTSHDQNFGR